MAVVLKGGRDMPVHREVSFLRLFSNFCSDYYTANSRLFLPFWVQMSTLHETTSQTVPKRMALVATTNANI